MFYVNRTLQNYDSSDKSDFELELHKESTEIVQDEGENEESLKENDNKMKSPCLEIAGKLLQDKTTCIIIEDYHFTC